MTATANQSQQRIADHRRAVADERNVQKLFGRMKDSKGCDIGHYFTVASASQPGNAHLVKVYRRGYRDYEFVCDPMCQRFYYERTCMHCVLVERWFCDTGALDDPLENSND